MAAVDGVTASLANTTLNSTESSEAVLSVVAEGRRLYIGNLAYAATEGELKEFFKNYEVESVSIPENPRTRRPVGYAFVDLKSADDATKAISELSGQEILSRGVSVQLARKPEENAPKAEEAAPAAEGADDAESRKRSSTRGRGRGRGRGGRARGGRTADGIDEPLPLVDESTTAPVANIEGAAESTPTSADDKSKARAPRPPRQRGPPEDGVPSKTKIMVANLPYDYSEEKLKELFSVYSPTAAKIALRPIPRFMVKKLQARGEARKGRGFGFVSLESEELQQKAVDEMNGKQIDGREIAVKVAIDSPGKSDIDPEAAGIAPLTENGVVQANDPPAVAA